MHIGEKFNIPKVVVEILGTILASAIMAIGIALFLLPNQLSSGGLAGIATVIYYLLKYHYLFYLGIKLEKVIL